LVFYNGKSDAHFEQVLLSTLENLTPILSSFPFYIWKSDAHFEPV
jgi:hypothetical protein